MPWKISHRASITNNQSDDILQLKNKIDGLNTAVSTLGSQVTSLVANKPLDMNYVTTRFPRLEKVCSSIYAEFPSSTTPVTYTRYVGTGTFITNDGNDYEKGYFLTAAHMVLKLSGNTLNKASAVYIENPVTKTWHKFLPSDWVYDGVADILLITTNFDLRQLDVAPLSIAQTPAKTGDVILICGDPGNYDYDSITLGYVRDANHMMKTSTLQITECIFVNGGTIGGNSGSAIVNENLEIVGLLCFSRDNDNPALGGGTNSNVINVSLPILLTGVNNVIKKYLGISWEYPKPWEIVELAETNPTLSPTIAGVQLNGVATTSPFYNILYSTDILLSAKVYDANDTLLGSYEFGYSYDMKTPGVMLYHYDATYALVTYIKKTTQQLMVDTRITLDKTYADVNENKDVFLNGGL